MGRKVLVKRHAGVVRVTHWINVAALFVLLLSGLQIFNAHPALYWGAKSVFADPWISLGAAQVGERMVGVTMIGGQPFDTTGVLGFSSGQVRGFPEWLTIPSWRDLASGRRWHFFFAWVFVLNGLIYLAWGVLSGHFRKDLFPTRQQLAVRHVWHEVLDHARLRFPKGERARVYNVLQKLSYLPIVLVFLPMMLLTGLCMSPAIGAAAPWLIELFGGRQSARTIHFLVAWTIVVFVLVHVLMVLVSGVVNNMRGMITGRYAIDAEEGAP